MQWACAILLFVAYPALQRILHIISLTARFHKKSIERKMCVLMSEKCLILRRIARDMVQMYVGLNVKHSFFLSDFNDTWIFSTDFRKNTRISNFIKISYSMRTDGQTDRRMDGQTGITKLIVAFRNLPNVPNNGQRFFSITFKIVLKQLIFVKLGSWDKGSASIKISIYQQNISQENINIRTPSQILIF